jgi:phosphohistidine phosphatase
MKTLYIIRHAKSSWDNALQDDFDRPLNERGMRDAPRMAKRLKEKDIHPDMMLSSPANRALSTCMMIAEVIKYPQEKIKTERSLYHANKETILKVIRNVKDKHNILLVFGHNPGLTDFVNELMDDVHHFIDNIPTCGIVAFSIDIDSWKKLDFGNAHFLFYDYPKSK